MQPIAHGFPEQVVSLLRERGCKESRALQVVHGVYATDSSRKCGASNMRWQLRLRRNYDDANLSRPVELRRNHRSIICNATGHKAAVQRCGDVIRMSFKLGSVILNDLIRYVAAGD